MQACKINVQNQYLAQPMKLLNSHQTLVLMGGWGLGKRLPGSWLSQSGQQ